MQNKLNRKVNELAAIAFANFQLCRIDKEIYISLITFTAWQKIYK